MESWAFQVAKLWPQLSFMGNKEAGLNWMITLGPIVLPVLTTLGIFSLLFVIVFDLCKQEEGENDHSP